MNIELTQQQQQALDDQGEPPPRIIDPRNNVAYYLVAAPDYEAVRDLLEEERRQRSIRAVGLRNAASRIREAPEVAMKFKVALYASEDGYSVSVPALPGYWSQGATAEEALANITDAIREYLATEVPPQEGAEVREVEVAV